MFEGIWLDSGPKRRDTGMRFNPKADLDPGRVDDAGGNSGSSRLPLPRSAGGGKLGLILLIVGFLVKYLASRRSAGAHPR